MQSDTESESSTCAMNAQSKGQAYTYANAVRNNAPTMLARKSTCVETSLPGATNSPDGQRVPAQHVQQAKQADDRPRLTTKPPASARAPVPPAASAPRSDSAACNGATAVPNTSTELAQQRGLWLEKIPANEFTLLDLTIPECDKNREFMRNGEVRVWNGKNQKGKKVPKRMNAVDVFRLMGYSKAQAHERAQRSSLLGDGIADADILDLKAALNVSARANFQIG